MAIEDVRAAEVRAPPGKALPEAPGTARLARPGRRGRSHRPEARVRRHGAEGHEDVVPLGDGDHSRLSLAGVTDALYGDPAPDRLEVEPRDPAAQLEGDP